MHVYNNTIVNGHGINQGISFYNGSNNYVYNNLWYNNQNVSFQGVTHDYNWFYQSETHSESHIEYGNGDPFVNIGQLDFRLVGATEAGIQLDPTYRMDMLGNIRGDDGLWDRGAFEY